MTSAGSMSGVNCNREKRTWMTDARVLTESVFANPGTPSSRTWPLANKPMMSRSTRYFWPTTTLLISLSSGGTNALACCTSALIALIPVFIFRDDNARWTILPADVFRKNQTGQPWRSHRREGLSELHCQGAAPPYAQPLVKPAMNGNWSVLRGHFRRMGAAYLVLILSLIPTFLAYRRLKENAAARDQARFEQAVQSTEEALVHGMENFVSALRGVRGLFDANQEVGPEHWQKFAHSIDLNWNYRGMLDMGFAERVLPEEKRQHSAAMRTQGDPSYTLVPEGERDEYFPIRYLSSATNSPKWAPGWDAFSEPKRRTAMESARLVDRPTATGKVTLFTPDGPRPEPGFVVYLPVYRDGVKPDKPGERRAATVGFVFASFVAQYFGESILAKRTNAPIALEVFDGDTPSAEGLLFDSEGLQAAGHTAASRPPSVTRRREGLGRTWILRFSALPAFEL